MKEAKVTMGINEYDKLRGAEKTYDRKIEELRRSDKEKRLYLLREFLGIFTYEAKEGRIEIDINDKTIEELRSVLLSKTQIFVDENDKYQVGINEYSR